MKSRCNPLVQGEDGKESSDIASASLWASYEAPGAFCEADGQCISPIVTSGVSRRYIGRIRCPPACRLFGIEPRCRCCSLGLAHFCAIYPAFLRQSERSIKRALHGTNTRRRWRKYEPSIPSAVPINGGGVITQKWGDSRSFLIDRYPPPGV